MRLVQLLQAIFAAVFLFYTTLVKSIVSSADDEDFYTEWKNMKNACQPQNRKTALGLIKSVEFRYDDLMNKFQGNVNKFCDDFMESEGEDQWNGKSESDGETNLGSDKKPKKTYIKSKMMIE
ncbi:UNKNOWN [Stylonychia lemnae]|uniref:Uncharacterized protein n=1 Tax=Stylonychia lemnae TaxID=5949 RepID=A0A077ZWT1_STYLE|nr:UNKNOWN [Stylonychia lemnae]|eukprot:CDW74366.1 UNKNOWN [Stylonychia lemnae]